MIPYSCQDIDDSDIEAVVEILQSSMLTQGPAVPAFEEAVAKRVGVAHSVAVSSATAALHLGCQALGVGPGDRVWTSPITFVSSANCALFCGAEVDFVDVETKTGNMCPEKLREKCEEAEKTGMLPKVVIPVHLAGNSCEMEAIHTLAEQYGFRILEDASHALGAMHAGKPVGCCDFSDAAVFSFHAVKMITTGEGGMLVTNDGKIAEQAATLRTHGITRDSGKFQFPDEGGWYYEMMELGFHYRMTDFQAGLGINQLKRLDSFLARRRELAAQYETLLDDLPLEHIHVSDKNDPSWHLYPVLLDLPEKRRELFNRMRAAGCGVNVHYIPVTRQPFYRKLGFKPEKFPGAEQFYEKELSIPLQTRMTNQEQEQVAAKLNQILCS